MIARRALAALAGAALGAGVVSALLAAWAALLANRELR